MASSFAVSARLWTATKASNRPIVREVRKRPRLVDRTTALRLLRRPLQPGDPGEPNTTYQVWRAIDFVPDGIYDPNAPGTGWAQIATITTSPGGAMEAHFIRGGGLFSGDRFDVLIEVRLNDSVTVLLQSEVMAITVK
jgi:hypothetical protein